MCTKYSNCAGITFLTVQDLNSPKHTWYEARFGEPKHGTYQKEILPSLHKTSSHDTVTSWTKDKSEKCTKYGQTMSYEDYRYRKGKYRYM